MSNTIKRWLSIVLVSGLVVLLGLGLLAVFPVLAQGPGWMHGGGMMGAPGYNNDAGGYGPGWMMGNTQGFTGTNQFGRGPGWMHGGGMMGGPGYNNNAGGYGPGWMMGNTQGFTGTNRFGFGPGWMMGNTQGFTGTNRFGFGPGWMMQNFFNNDGSSGFGSGGMMGMMGGGMMVHPNNPFYTAPQPLTLDEASAILNAYLADVDDANLTYQDVMIFDNHAYAQIVEQDSGIGVLEVLIDPTTRTVFPEMGPNMMWNQKYGMMSGYGGYGMMRGMMRLMHGFDVDGFDFGDADSPAEMTITPAQAAGALQNYLNKNYSGQGLTADEHAERFYGYYTLHVDKNGEPVGMASVNGYTGAVWPHTWHGKLLQMSPEE